MDAEISVGDVLATRFRQGRLPSDSPTTNAALWNPYPGKLMQRGEGPFHSGGHISANRLPAGLTMGPLPGNTTLATHVAHTVKPPGFSGPQPD